MNLKLENAFLCDWIQGTLPLTDVNSVFDFLCSFPGVNRENFTEFNSGLLNFKRRFGYNDTGIIQVCWSPCDDYDMIALRPEECSPGVNPGIYIVLSGDGLRKIGSENHNKLFKWLYDNKFSCTRFDVAMDIYNEDNLIVPCIIEAFENVLEFERGDKTLKTRLPRDSFIIHQYSDRQRNKVIKNCECRSSYSELGRFKMYDKYYEINTVARLKKVSDELLKEIPSNYWYRLEYTIKKKYSQSLFLSMVENNYDIVAMFKWAVGRFFTVVIGKTAGYEFSHLDKADIWVDFISYLEQISSELSFNLAKYSYVASDDEKYFLNNIPSVVFKCIFLALLNNNFLNEVLRKGAVSIEKKRNLEWREFISQKHNISFDIYKDLIKSGELEIQLCSPSEEGELSSYSLPFGD